MVGTQMNFTLQSAGPFLHWLALAILCVMPVVISILAYKIGGLPGEIAKARKHPQAQAISVCGWMGIITFVLWPVAMVWAYLNPSRPGGSPLQDRDRSIIDKLRQASQRLAAIEENLPKADTRGG
jgi:hypothetical protein